MAYSSLIEVLDQLIISNDLSFLKNDKLSEGRTLIENLTSKVAALRNAQLNKVS